MIQKFQRNATIRERRAWIRLCAYCCGTIVQEELDWILHDVVALFFRFRLDETYLLDVILLYTVGSFRSGLAQCCSANGPIAPSSALKNLLSTFLKNLQR
ncbi:uncharacterized protein OCT59_023516 [Rhizophagus irregularis]|uniref:uncharacterized protein n=1 Tax=Rhizophagus irregularis TaxID=588596 RepID=UPI001C16B0EA|nr:hypothetical protein OCT59_023516 [Rhizophagus irregularis]CAB5350300.1 unnamed protein product [Rhizophagus irregularis]CAB5391487.1 unnamed protein product [Rhizophagus irregularis]